MPTNRGGSVLDFETQPELSIRVSATDADGLSGFASFTVFVTDGNDWHNVNAPLDVTKNGTVEPLDALIVINWINSQGSAALPGIAGVPEFFLDTNDDRFVSSLDVLIVINHLNGSSGEGESPRWRASLAPEWTLDGLVAMRRMPATAITRSQIPQLRAQQSDDDADRVKGKKGWPRKSIDRQVDQLFGELDDAFSWR